MKLLSYLINNKNQYGIYNHNDNGVIDLTTKIGSKYLDLKSLIAAPDAIDIIRKFENKKIDFEEDEITFLPVIPNPNKIICAGMNYPEKCMEFDVNNNLNPTLFIRFADSQTGHNTEILKPKISDQFDYEGELAVIIGKECFRIKSIEANDYIFGYSCYMDGSVRDWQHTWFTAGKNWPRTGAFGPYIVTKEELDPNQLIIKTFLNNRQVQEGFIKDLIHPIPKLISYISTFTKLNPGDVILTGSPGGVGKKRNPPLFMKENDVIEVEISKLGRLKNFIING